MPPVETIISIDNGPKKRIKVGKKLAVSMALGEGTFSRKYIARGIEMFHIRLLVAYTSSLCQRYMLKWRLHHTSPLT